MRTQYIGYFLIEIIGAINTNVWYSKRQGQRFEASMRNTDGEVVFMIGSGFKVNPQDCIVIRKAGK